MTHPTLVYRLHAVQRMFERKIPAKKVRQAIETGETIEDYSNEIIVITVYEPDPEQWEADFRRRKK